jgi:hypothetical protein
VNGDETVTEEAEGAKDHTSPVGGIVGLAEPSISRSRGCSRELLLYCRPQFVNLPLKPRNPLELLVLFAPHLNQEVFHPRQSFRHGLNDGGQNLWNFRATGLFLRWHSVDSPAVCWKSRSEPGGIYTLRRKKATRRDYIVAGDVLWSCQPSAWGF